MLPGPWTTSRSHAAENWLSVYWRPVARMLEVPNRLQKTKRFILQLPIVVAPSSTRLRLCEEEWWQHTRLSESNTHGERLWFHSANGDVNFWAEMQWFDDQWEAAVNNILAQHSPTLFTRNPVVCLLEVSKTMNMIFSYNVRIDYDVRISLKFYAFGIL